MQTRGLLIGVDSGVFGVRSLIALGLATVLVATHLVFMISSPAYAAGSLSLRDTISGASSYRLASNPAISGDGRTIIYGQPGHWAGWATRHRATVEVREWNGSTWVAKGSLPDAGNREIGFWHDISDDGKVVSHSTSALDQVFVYDYAGGSWVQRPLVTASQEGASIVRHSLSGDGTVLVVGERGFDDSGGTDNGKVRIFDWYDEKEWIERTPFIGDDGEKLGDSRMDVSSDGKTISFGGSSYDSGDDDDVGRIRVATWNGSSWSERPSITGSQASAAADNPVISDDASVLAFTEAEYGVSGRVRSFDWNGSSWDERPVAADGSVAWIDLDMSSSGGSISVADNASQKLRAYDWVGNSWVQRGSDAPSSTPGGGGHYGNVASMSSDGLLVATSQVYSDINGFRSGQIDIYESASVLRGVTFDANEGSGSMSVQSEASSAPLTANSFTRTGYTFSGWNTDRDGTGTAYADEATYGFAVNVTLYAQWSALPSVTFDANEGSGSMSVQSEASSAPLTANSFTRTGYTFSGWNTDRDGKGTAYAEGADYDFAADVTLYAQWSAIATPGGDSGGSSNAPVKLEEADARPLAVAPQRGFGFALRQAPVEVPRDVQGKKFKKPVALLAGSEAEVMVEAKGEQKALWGVGKFFLDIDVKEGDGKVDFVDGKPSLKIGLGASADVKVSGLRANSRMQVFLPAVDGSFVELPSVPVKTDGSIDDALTFATPDGQKPLPIGDRFIQIYGLDEDGNQTVLEMPVTISQPLPAPAINRSTGERPVLTPGQSFGLDGGDPQAVSLSVEDESLFLVGDGWSFEVRDSPSNPGSEEIAFTRDSPMVFAGAGFMPGTRADVWLFSDPTLLGTVDIDADGTFEANFAVDSNFVPTGNHTLQIQGVGEDGFVKAANIGVVVEDPAFDPVIPIESSPVDWLPLVLILTSLGGLILVSGAIMAIQRRRPVRGGPLPAA